MRPDPLSPGQIELAVETAQSVRAEEQDGALRIAAFISSSAPLG
jgi:hypothetical protein